MVQPLGCQFLASPRSLPILLLPLALLALLLNPTIILNNGQIYFGPEQRHGNFIQTTIPVRSQLSPGSHCLKSSGASKSNRRAAIVALIRGFDKFSDYGNNDPYCYFVPGIVTAGSLSVIGFVGLLCRLTSEAQRAAADQPGSASRKNKRLFLPHVIISPG